MTLSPLVSIVVPSRDGKIDRLRAELAKQSFQDYEIVVNTEPPTPAHARNGGAADAIGEYLIFFDDDVRLSHPGLLGELVQALQNAVPLSVVGVRDALAKDTNWFQRYIYCRSFHPEVNESADPVVEVNWHGVINGRCMAMSRQTFDAIGGYDSKLIAGEDFEILYRIQRAGGKVYALSKGRVYYYPPPTLKVLLKKTIWYAHGNAQVARKYPESNYSWVLKGVGSAVFFLIFRTLCLIPLSFLKMSYHNRRIRFAFRPFEVLLSYFAAWVYCIAWFKTPPTGDPNQGLDAAARISTGVTAG
ncbi:MAG: glycosyltransferase [Candidatus Omnitrophota bacterium]|nr:glycosyltransferase [Candidatus Omnitrophota bacterium]